MSKKLLLVWFDFFWLLRKFYFFWVSPGDIWRGRAKQGTHRPRILMSSTHSVEPLSKQDNVGRFGQLLTLQPGLTEKLFTSDGFKDVIVNVGHLFCYLEG